VQNKNQIIHTLQSGGTILIATDTVYGLAALLSDEKAVAKIYDLKGRPREMFLPIWPPLQNRTLLIQMRLTKISAIIIN
jgi:L-threonylcarbamoyladenylate synthase